MTLWIWLMATLAEWRCQAAHAALRRWRRRSFYWQARRRLPPETAAKVAKREVP